MGPDRGGGAEDMSKAPPRHCARLEVISIQTGTSLTGKKTPARKISGKIRIWIRTWKPCCDCMNEAIRIPRPESASDKMITTGISFSTIVRVSETPTMGASTSITSACSNATTVPPAAFPNTIPVRPRGATRISLRKPYSRSQTTEMPAKSELARATGSEYMNALAFAKSRLGLPRSGSWRV